MKKDLLDKLKTQKGKPTEGEGKDRQLGRNTEKLSERPGIGLGKLKSYVWPGMERASRKDSIGMLVIQGRLEKMWALSGRKQDLTCFT